MWRHFLDVQMHTHTRAHAQPQPPPSHTTQTRIGPEGTSVGYLAAQHATFADARFLYFVHDYQPGGELFKRLQTETRFSEAQTARWIAQLADALRVVHGALGRDEAEEACVVWGGHLAFARSDDERTQPHHREEDLEHDVVRHRIVVRHLARHARGVLKLDLVRNSLKFSHILAYQV